MANNEQHGAGFLDGLFLGVILGGVLGVLFAPQSGEQSRAWLKKLKEDNQDVIDDAVVNSEYLIKTAKQSIEDGFKNVSKMLDEKLSKTKDKEKDKEKESKAGKQ